MLKIGFYTIAIVVFSLFVLPVLTVAGDAPIASDGCLAPLAKISYDDLKKAIADKKVVIVDCNGKESFAKGRIVSAIDGKAEGFEKKLPADKKALIVAYSGSEKCSDWQDGAVKLTKLGYSNVKQFEGGLKGWVAAGGELEK